MGSVIKQACTASAFAAAALMAAGGVAAAQDTGPSTTTTPYALPSLAGDKTTSILSVGDSVGGYRMVGIPDGLGAFENLDGTFTLVMNHELGNTVGAVRAHGGTGAFVSKWVIDKTTLQVQSGSDLMKQIYLWDNVNQRSATVATPFAFNRFCSGDLPKSTAFYYEEENVGTQARIYMHGEEGGATGYQLGSVVTGPDAGKTYVLGKFTLATNGSGGTAVGAWENSLASPYPQLKTVVIGNNDGGTGIMTNSVSVYVGTKQNTGSEVDKAGLTNGTLKFISVAGSTAEVVNNTTRVTNITSGTRFSLSATASTTFSRPEDGAWNPLNAREYYFVTTDQLDQVSDNLGAQVGQTRLWRLTFDDITDPDLGGKIDLLIDGRTVGGEKVNMFDNLTVNQQTGVLLIQEDVGNAAHNGKMWMYNPATDELKRVVKHDAARFGDVTTNSTAPYNRDEETSGVLDMSSILGPDMYITSDQAHYAINAANPNGFSNPDELVEGGQLIALRIVGPAAASVPATSNPWLALCAGVLALMSLVFIRRARSRTV